MRIFNRKKDRREPELALSEVSGDRKYDFWAALAKALLIFLLVYGALGGFLSAFEIEYNKGICILALLLLSLLLSAVYETGKRWLTNLCGLVFFGGYIYMASTNYWVINSGYYSILNQIYAVARDYLGVSGGTEYTLVVEEEYLTVTIFVLFIGLVGTMLFNIYLQYKCNLLRLFVLTFTPYVIPLYLERSPALIYMIFLFTGYAAAVVLRSGDVREHLSGQMRYVLPLAMVVTVIILRGISFLMPESNYDRIMPANASKRASEESIGNIAQYGLAALFQRGQTGAGISGGVLSQGSSVVPSGETDLIVRYTPYSFDPIYLKAFTGMSYEGTRWSRADEEWPDDGRMESTMMSRKETYQGGQGGDFLQGRGVMEVERAGASAVYEYRPYYTDYDEIQRQGNVTTYVYYPDTGDVSMLPDWPGSGYLQVPDSCLAAVQQVCEEAGLSGTPEEIAAQIIAYFQENYSYTLRPGYNYRRTDYITYFLLQNKRGYCAHFASAGTMLLRNMGIPARYVEGYAFSYLNVVEDGLLVEGADYADYYDGYSPLGETALVEMEIPDAYAHAWVEYYVEGCGWVVMDPTPSSAEQDTTSFWDAFMNVNSDEGDLNVDLGTGVLGAYLEGALSGITYLLLLAAVLAVIVFTVVQGLRVRRESRLPGRERAKLEYSRIQRRLAKKHQDYRSLRTLRQQLDRMRQIYGLEISEELEQSLYQAFFAGETDHDYERLYGELRGLRRKLARSRPVKRMK
ncbi:MAG: transglutaminase-like domain-containing protein [Clostridium sp.]|nr:transglutaminase-like domain-containing protein [Acetatifactor muris]MCM1527507.1 transglutaminase-like domain-containing protein [Bacteroides sp.]MCM1563749.1 transglutaminase-like domain-containing protein [Clostridium sp.]